MSAEARLPAWAAPFPLRLSRIPALGLYGWVFMVSPGTCLERVLIHGGGRHHTLSYVPPKAQVVLVHIVGGLAHPLTVFPQVGYSQLNGCPLVAAVWSYLFF